MTAHDASADRRGIGFWIGLVTGGGLMAYGIVGMLGASAATQPQNLTGFLLGAAIVHDTVIAPTVVIVGWLVTRLLPPVTRLPVWFGLAASALLIGFTWPLVRGWGRRSANPSLLPFDYGRNVVIGVIVIWIVAAAEIARRLVAERKAS